MSHSIKLSTIILFVFCSCTYNADQTYEPEENLKIATSSRGMVAAAQPLATKAGNAILEAGGNAADAAIATAFTIAVVEPTMNGIGGRSQILVRKGDGTFIGYNGMTEVPQLYKSPDTPVSSGHETIATPGVVAALIRLHEEHGSMPLDKLMAYAIKYAEEGFEMLPGEAARHAFAHIDMLADPGFRKQMLKNDSVLYMTGEVLKQPDLAETLKRIASTNGKDFYEGETASRIVKDMKANNGFVTLQDLKNYKALDARYVTTNYRGYDIHSIPAPAGGGLVVKALNILEQFDLSTISDAQWAAIVNQALAISIQDMTVNYQENDLELVQSKEWAKEQSKSIVVPKTIDHKSKGEIKKPKSKLLASNTDWSGNSWGDNSHHTTHFVTADEQGMVVSITQTVGPLFGSKVITPGLGFVYASTMGAYLSSSDQAPGSRPRTTIAPTIVTKNGETVMVLGAAGGLRILSGIVQTISRSIDRGMNIEEAVRAPRIHPNAGVDPTTGTYRTYGMRFSAEFTPINGWTKSDSLDWSNSGFKVTKITRYGAFARVHALSRNPATNIWTGMADLDWEGSAKGPSK